MEDTLHRRYEKGKEFLECCGEKEAFSSLCSLPFFHCCDLCACDAFLLVPLTGGV
jgi:hypothetical protein